MRKIQLWFEFLRDLFIWALKTLWKDYLVDLHFDKIPLHPDDYIHYAERWNGRFAMFGIILILQLELIYKVSVWELIGVL